MIHTISALRRLLYRVRSRLLPETKPSRDKPVQPGLPEGLEYDTFHDLFQQHFDGNVHSTTYQHLSGWKSSGAYRIRAVNIHHDEISLIYKEASYSLEEIPALQGLPIQPGPAEYGILSQPPGELKPFIPEVYIAEEVEAGKCYRYLFEDLGETCHPARKAQDILLASHLLPGMHQAFARWAETASTDHLIQYGQDFSKSLEVYAHPRLEEFARRTEAHYVQSLLKVWDDISNIHLQPEFFDQVVRTPIHGDSNFSNIHIVNDRPGEIKLVDWEWAGFGNVYADLASLLKGSGKEIEQHAVQRFNEWSTSTSRMTFVSKQSFERLYFWSQLERGLLDASFLAAQYLGTNHQANFSLPRAVEAASHRTIDALSKLTS